MRHTLTKYKVYIFSGSDWLARVGVLGLAGSGWLPRIGSGWHGLGRVGTGWLGFAWAGAGWLGLARVGLGWLGYAWACSGWLGLARVGSGWLGLVNCILLNSIFGTAPLDVFPTSPARSAGLSYTIIYATLKIRVKKRIPALFL